MNLIIYFIAYFCIYIAVNIGREKTLTMDDKRYWIQIILVTIGGVLLINSDRIVSAL